MATLLINPENMEVRVVMDNWVLDLVEEMLALWTFDEILEHNDMTQEELLRELLMNGIIEVPEVLQKKYEQ